LQGGVAGAVAFERLAGRVVLEAVDIDVRLRPRSSSCCGTQVARSCRVLVGVVRGRPW
jgi:hypothetical protein